MSNTPRVVNVLMDVIVDELEAMEVYADDHFDVHLLRESLEVCFDFDDGVRAA